MSDNSNLQRAKDHQNNDEFYTRREDIENELRYYKSHFKDKVVLCNCDDPRVSEFFFYFSYNFEHLGLKKLITTCYKSQQRDLFSQNKSERAIMLEYNGDKNGNRVPDLDEIEVKELDGDGDFRSAECIELLKQADIVVTNPPFSLFREYVDLLMEHEKKFLIIGHMSGLIYRSIFTKIMQNEVWLGVNDRIPYFYVPDSYAQKLLNGEGNYKIFNGKVAIKMGNVYWYSNLEHNRPRPKLALCKTYNEKDYPEYDNYKIINVDKVKDIPRDYDGVMGVPISFLEKYNPEQFQIIGCDRILPHDARRALMKEEAKALGNDCHINGVEKFRRIFITNRDIGRFND